MARTDDGAASRKPYVIKITDEIWTSGEAHDVADWLSEKFMSDPAVMRNYREGIELGFGSMPEDGRPAWAIPALARTLVDLDSRWPYALFFLSRDGNALRVHPTQCWRREGGSVGVG